MNDWPADVERVSAFLLKSGAEARIEEFDDETATAADAARAVGCEIGAIVKSLVVLCDERPGVALVPGDRRGDTAKIARQAVTAIRRPAVQRLRESLNERQLAIGVDRLDYSKGLPQRVHDSYRRPCCGYPCHLRRPT